MAWPWSSRAERPARAREATLGQTSSPSSVAYGTRLEAFASLLTKLLGACLEYIGDYPVRLTLRFRVPIFQSPTTRLEMAGKSHREGITLVQLMDMFPTEAAAVTWFESTIWDGGRHCPKCGSTTTKAVPNAKPMPYWCTDCRSYFSVRTGTPMAHSNVPLRKWALAIYLCITSLKSVSSMKLSRDIGVKQATAWFMLHRIREAWAEDGDEPLDGPAEVDETYFGGKRENMPLAKRKTLTGRGTAGKTAVVGVKDRESNEVRAEVVERTDSADAPGASSVSTSSPAPPSNTDNHGGLSRVCRGSTTKSVNHSVSRVRARHGAHERNRELLGDAQTRARRHVPQNQPEASATLRLRVCREAQHPRVRNPCPNAGYCRPPRRSPTPLPPPRRGQRAFQRGPAIAAPLGGTRRAPASPASRPSSELSGQVRNASRHCVALLVILVISREFIRLLAHALEDHDIPLKSMLIIHSMLVSWQECPRTVRKVGELMVKKHCRLSRLSLGAKPCDHCITGTIIPD